MAASRAHPKWGGRTKGTPNKATGEVRELAQACAPAAIAELARLAAHAKTEATRVAAIKEILDRAHGKAAQAVELGGRRGDPIPVEMVPSAAEQLRAKLEAMAKRMQEQPG